MAFLLGRASLNDKAGCCGDDGWQLIEIVGSLSSHSEAEARRRAVGWMRRVGVRHRAVGVDRKEMTQ